MCLLVSVANATVSSVTQNAVFGEIDFPSSASPSTAVGSSEGRSQDQMIESPNSKGKVSTSANNLAARGGIYLLYYRHQGKRLCPAVPRALPMPPASKSGAAARRDHSNSRKDSEAI